MRLLTKHTTATVKRSGWRDAQLTYVHQWKLLGITVFQLTFDVNRRWINPLV